MSLRAKATAGAKWTTISTVVSVTVQMTQFAVLARLLNPEDFGLMAMILVVLGFAQIYADFGISNAIIHKQDNTQEKLSSLYWLNILAGGAVFIVILMLTPLIVLLYQEPRLSDLVWLAALSVLVLPFGQQFHVLLQKELRFNKLAKIEIFSALCGFMVSIASAIYGQGVLALIWGQLTNTTVKTVLFTWIGWQRWRPSIHFNRKDLDGYLGFGLYQLGERSVNYITERIDQLLIGSLLGAQVLGFYNLAFNIVIIPVSRINPILTRVAFPIFAKVQQDLELLRKGYLLLLRLLSIVNFPLLLGLISVAPTFVPVVFGEEWLPMVPLVQLLAVVALMMSTGNPVGSLLLAKGRADLGFKWTAMVTLVQIPSIFLAAKYGGVIAIILTLIILQIIYSVLSYLLLIRPLLGACLKDYLMSMFPTFAIACIMAVLVGTIDLNVQLVNGSIKLLIEIGLGAAIFLILASIFRKNEILEFRKVLLKQ